MWLLQYKEAEARMPSQCGERLSRDYATTPLGSVSHLQPPCDKAKYPPDCCVDNICGVHAESAAEPFANRRASNKAPSSKHATVCPGWHDSCTVNNAAAGTAWPQCLHTHDWCAGLLAELVEYLLSKLHLRNEGMFVVVRAHFSQGYGCPGMIATATQQWQVQTRTQHRMEAAANQISSEDVDRVR